MSQGLVWAAIITERLELYSFEELGWLFIFLANTIASAYLYLTVGAIQCRERLLLMSMVFGIVYMPFQLIHLRSLRAEAIANRKDVEAIAPPIGTRIALGLQRAMLVRVPRTDADSWGGLVGLIWMFSYFALIPLWIYCIVRVLSPR